MRTPGFLRLRLLAPLRRRRDLLPWLVEFAILGWAVALLEVMGPLASLTGGEFVGFLLGGLVALVLVKAARAGLMPRTRNLLRSVPRVVRAAGRRLAPPSGVAFRLPSEPSPRIDRARRAPTLALVLLACLALAGGDAILQALLWVRTELSFTVYLLGLTALWALYGTVTLVALVTARAGLVRRGKTAARVVPLAVWVASVIALAWLPGFVPVALLGFVVLGLAPWVFRTPAGRYHLYRREQRAEAGLTAITVHGYLQSAFLGAAALMFLVVALAQAPRLTSPVMPTGTFALTLALGLSATAAGLYLVFRSGLHLLHLVGPRASAPEIPLTPTLWWPGGDAATTPSWLQPAREGGWSVALDEKPPRDGYDLVVGRDDDPRSFAPADAPSAADARFRLERRFHVVMRRAFFRRFHSLHKAITAPPRVPGSGYLLCPHAWPVRGIVRDTGGVDPEDPSGRPLGGTLVGRPYDVVFPTRVRRYVGGVLRALSIDVIYWEDRVAWADLRRVLGVVFETYDQRRFPALDRHFIGFGRIRVVIQEPEECDPTVPEVETDPTAPQPLRARILVIRRDDGGREVEAPDRAPPIHQPEPSMA